MYRPRRTGSTMEFSVLRWLETSPFSSLYARSDVILSCEYRAFNFRILSDNWSAVRSLYPIFL